jgi:thiol-disulfide isomerase/thioredoxin
MAKTPSTMLPLGTAAKPFDLTAGAGPEGQRRVRLSDFDGAPALLVMFICNHCPYVKLIADELGSVTKRYAAKGVAVVGINSNDAEKYPDDRPEKMLEEKAARGWTFPYLYDADQSVAKAYQAACTPDFFLFDKARRLVYRGQFDGARPGNGIAVTGEDLTRAVELALAGKGIAEAEQRPSIGCNIKWRPGNEPRY